MKTWRNLMFNDDELICSSDFVFGTKAQIVNDAIFGQYVCLNPLKGPRADSNVSTFRNLLFEFDQGTLEEQKRLINESELPYSLVTFSGNKSLHAVICLESPLENVEEYRKVIKAAYKKFPTIDKSCSNPSRFTRTPDGYNIKTNHIQEVWAIKNSRTPTQEFLDWVGPVEPENLKTEAATKTYDGLEPLLSIFTKHYLAFGSDPGKRNSDLFKASCDLCRCGWSAEEVFAVVADKADLPIHEIRQTIRSAFKSAQGQK